MVIFFRQHIPYQKGCDQSVTKHPKTRCFRTEIIFLTDWGPDTFKKIKKKLGAVAQGAFSARKNTHKSTFFEHLGREISLRSTAALRASERQGKFAMSSDFFVFS